MSQSAVIFGAIILAFFVFITRKGELPVYAGLLLLAPASPTNTQSSSTAATASANTLISGAFGALGL